MKASGGPPDDRGGCSRGRRETRSRSLRAIALIQIPSWGKSLVGGNCRSRWSARCQAACAGSAVTSVCGNRARDVSGMGALAGDLAQSAKPRDRSHKCTRDLVTGSVGECPRPTVSASLIRADRPRQRPLASTVGKCSPGTPSAVLLGNGFRRPRRVVQSERRPPGGITP